MKKLFTILVIIASTTFISKAQEVESIEETVDSIIFVPTSTMDETLVGTSVFDGLTIHQSSSISNALARKIEANKSKKISGYRIRIYFDNKQNSRSESEAVKKQFESLYPGYGTYLSFTSPYFKVTVGNFRTKTDAMQFLQTIKGEFPSAFVIKENIDFPPVDKNNMYKLDTLKIAVQESVSL